MNNSTTVTLSVTPQELRDALTEVLRGVCLLPSDSFDTITDSGHLDLTFLLLQEVQKQCDNPQTL